MMHKLACLGIFLGLGSHLMAAPAVPDLSPSKKLIHIQHDIKTLRQSIRKNKAQLSQQSRHLKRIEKKLGRLKRRLHDIKAGLAQTEKGLVVLGQRRRQANTLLIQQRTALRTTLLSRYRLGRKGKIQLLLDKQGSMPVGRLLVYYRYLHQGLNRDLAALNTTLAEIDVVAVKKRRARSRLAELTQASRQTLIDLHDEGQRRSVTVASLDVALQNKEARLAVALEDEARLGDLIQMLRENTVSAVVSSGPFDAQRGVLPWPVNGRIAARFGHRRNRDGLRWRGIKIAAKKGASVRAIFSGSVIFSDWLRGFGLLLIIDHGAGYMSLYGHNQSLYKRVGEDVIQGEEIARVGMSGGLLKPALYFEIRHNGQPEDPQIWSQGRYP